MTQPNIFQEIEEDLERQKMEDLWKRYGPYVIAAAFAVILATAAVTEWRSWRTERNQAATDQLMAILQKADASRSEEEKALEAFAQKNPDTVQAVLGRLYNAAAVAKDGDKTKAVALYDSVAHDTKADSALRQFADLMAVQVQIDTADPGALRQRLKPLWADGAPWRYTALDYEGHLALKFGDKKGAAQAFSLLAHDGGTPVHLSENATEMLRFIGE